MLIENKELKAINQNIKFTKDIAISLDGTTLLSAPNGFGKTTILNYIHEKFQDQYKCYYMPQSQILFSGIKVNELIELIGSRYEYELDVNQLLSDLQFNNFKKLFKRLSGGEKQKVMLAIALSIKCDILLLDEPLNNLDHDAVDVTTKLLTTINKPIIVVSHLPVTYDREVTLDE